MQSEQNIKDMTELRAQVKKEAQEYLSLVKEIKNKYEITDDKGWLISKLWLRKWKKYVGYEAVKNEHNTYFSRELKKHDIDKESFPGPICNDILLLSKDEYYNDGNMDLFENMIIKPELDLRDDIRIINEKIWNFFHKRYGGGPLIIKPVIKDGHRKVYEVFYTKFNILVLPTKQGILKNESLMEEVKALYCKRSTTLPNLKSKILSIVIKQLYQNDQIISDKIDKKEIGIKNLKLWSYSGTLRKDEVSESLNQSLDKIKSNELLKIDTFNYCEYLPNVTAEELGIESSDTLIIEFNPEAEAENTVIENSNTGWMLQVSKIDLKKSSCDWCRKDGLYRITCLCKEVWYCSEACKIRDTNYHEGYCKKRLEIEESGLKTFSKNSKKGLVGLQNLGNTCFMNTSLQCISNCYELAQFFLSDSYLKDINTDNPLGTQGALARSYATLLKNLYYGESGSFNPRNFKRAIGAFQSMFTGYQQHDTQEFLNYLLDGLHEDLNRVQKKPFIEKDESLKDDSVKSKEQWTGFLRRNQSALVDLLYGQYKSTITCPCSNISTTFDPFLSISLPLISRTQPFEIVCFFVFYDTSLTPLELKLSFCTRTTIMALRNKLSKILNINPMSFIIARLDERVEFESYLNAKTFLLQNQNKYFQDKSKPLFVYQINPELFESSKYNIPNNIFNKDFALIEDYLRANNDKISSYFDYNYEEEEKDNTEEIKLYYSTTNFNSYISKEKSYVKYSSDNNYGLPQNYIITQVYLTEEKYDGCYLGIPRLIYFNVNQSVQSMYKQIFDYLYDVIKPIYQNITKDDLFNSFLIGKEELPFKIYANTFYHSNFRVKTSLFSGESTNVIDGAVDLDFKCESSLNDYILKVPKNEIDMSLDNTFFFMNDNKKHYSNLDNRDIYMKVAWNKTFKDILENLNKKNSFDLKKSEKKMKESIDLDECFKQFCKEEQLEEGNEWYCTSCKNHTKAKVHMELYKLPPVLIVHLKRFKNNKKIDTLVDFPINELNMSQYLIGENSIKNNNYELFAVAHHYGGMGGGHYVASAKNYFDEKWYNFNDSSVSSERNPNDVVSSSAYVLFYKHKEIKNLNLDEIYNRSFIDFESK